MKTTFYEEEIKKFVRSTTISSRIFYVEIDIYEMRKVMECLGGLRGQLMEVVLARLVLQVKIARMHILTSWLIRM